MNVGVPIGALRAYGLFACPESCKVGSMYLGMFDCLGITRGDGLKPLELSTARCIPGVGMKPLDIVIGVSGPDEELNGLDLFVGVRSPCVKLKGYEPVAELWEPCLWL